MLASLNHPLAVIGSGNRFTRLDSNTFHVEIFAFGFLRKLATLGIIATEVGFSQLVIPDRFLTLAANLQADNFDLR